MPLAKVPGHLYSVPYQGRLKQGLGQPAGSSPWKINIYHFICNNPYSLHTNNKQNGTRVVPPEFVKNIRTR